MSSLNGRLKEITTPLRGPPDDYPLGVVVDLVREMGRCQETIEIFRWGVGIGERLIDLLQVEGAT